MSRSGEAVMSGDIDLPPPNPRLPFTNPWPLLGSALGAAVLAMLVHGSAPQLVGLRVVLIVAGLVMALGAVGVQLRTVKEVAEQRIKAATVLALAAAVPFLCGL